MEVHLVFWVSSMKQAIKEESIVKPSAIRGFKQKTVVCVPYDPPSLPILKHLKITAKKETKIPLGRLFILEDRALLYGVVGAPALGICLETLIASGARQILFLGFCGSLNPDISLLTAISVSKAFSDEGTSRHYFKDAKIFLPSSSLKTHLEETLTSQGKTLRPSSVVSTDAPYRETLKWVAEQQKKGIDCVDMEVSAVFSIAEYHGIQAAALLLVSDTLASGKWKKAFTYLTGRKKIEEYFFPFFYK